LNDLNINCFTCFAFFSVKKYKIYVGLYHLYMMYKISTIYIIYYDLLELNGTYSNLKIHDLLKNHIVCVDIILYYLNRSNRKTTQQQINGATG